MKKLALAVIITSFLLLLNTYYYLNHELCEEFPDNEDVIEGFEDIVSIYETVINKSCDGFLRAFSTTSLLCISISTIWHNYHLQF